MYYENGQLSVKGNQNDRNMFPVSKDGRWEFFYENSQLRRVENWKDGKKDGVFEEYLKNGTLSLRQNYKNDVLTN